MNPPNWFFATGGRNSKYDFESLKAYALVLLSAKKLSFEDIPVNGRMDTSH